VVDPLDGTANFASGKDRFAIIVCLVRDTVAVGGWILDLPTGRMAMALKGEGVTLDGAPVRRPEPVRPPIGFVGYKVKKEFDRQLPADKRSSLGRVSTLNCAGAEYHEILAGRADFNLYRMTKSWDHAAGTLMIAEAGGEAQRFDGKPYAPAQPINSGLIAAIHPQTLAQVRTLFEAVRMPLLAGLPKI
jgi:fructose-1,6-bisphosphatase/inositol monophosphatase family enzyme